jgi:2'-5' RNA ligase
MSVESSIKSSIESRRLFLAFDPPPEVRQKLVEARAATERRLLQAAKARGLGRMVAASNLHITVHFLGQVSVERIDDLNTIEIDSVPFSIQLDTFGCFKRAGIIWLGCSQQSQALTRLHEQLKEQLVERNFPVESRPFTPHVTLFRKSGAIKPFALEPAVEWCLDSLVLMESVPQSDGTVAYEVRHQWEFVKTG